MAQRIMVLHGPNLNLLGKREPHIYGEITLQSINTQLEAKAEEMDLELEIHQSNHEGVLVDFIQEAPARCAAILINPAALTHYSIALFDALKAADLPAVEIHLSNIYCREEFRQKSVVSPAVNGVISGLGSQGYLLGLEALASLLKEGTQ